MKKTLKLRSNINKVIDAIDHALEASEARITTNSPKRKELFTLIREERYEKLFTLIEKINE